MLSNKEKALSSGGKFLRWKRGYTHHQECLASTFSNVSCSNSNAATESSESQAQENNENPVIKNEEGSKVSSERMTTCQLELHVLQRCTTTTSFPHCLSQEEPSQNVTPNAETEASPVKRRGRPPKTAAAAGAPVAVAEKEGAAVPTGGGRGRKRAADPNSNPTDSINIKMSKQQQQNDEGTKRQIDLQR